MTDAVPSDRALSSNSTLSSKRDLMKFMRTCRKLMRAGAYHGLQCTSGSVQGRLRDKDNHRKGHTVPAASEQCPRYFSE